MGEPGVSGPPWDQTPAPLEEALDGVLGFEVASLSDRRLYRGRSTWLWEVFLEDDQGKLCAVSRVTLAIRPRPYAVE
jgi:hypothetical protein